MGDLRWTRRGFFSFQQKAFRLHATCLGASGSGKTETLFRIAYGAHKVYRQQIILLDAKGETKRDEEMSQDNASRFVATMQRAGAKTVQVFPALSYNGWQGSPTELKNRLLTVIDYSESAYYEDVAANVLDLALFAPTTPRSSAHFLANLNLDRLKAIYKDTPEMLRRVKDLDKKLLQQVEMRYQVFFSAMAGQLDGTLDYADADAVYLCVRGFTLRNEAPRLGRFLVSDFMHYMAERRRAGVQTLFIIDEFNALRMREETSILFEQARSFGGNLVISAQGYTGLGPPEYADRLLDACSTYILHACSEPGPVSHRAGKKFFLDTSWSEDEEGIPRKHIRVRYDWRVPETAVIQQEEGQAYWIYRGRSQHVQTALVQLTPEQISAGWKEIRIQKEIQHQLSEAETQGKAEQTRQKAATSKNTQEQQKQNASPKNGSTTTRKKSSQDKTQWKTEISQQPSKFSPRNSPSHPAKQAVPPASPPGSRVPPTPNPDDTEPDRL